MSILVTGGAGYIGSHTCVELLEKGYQGSIQEVAALVGYDDAYHFSKLFKKRYGISPSQIRKG